MKIAYLSTPGWQELLIPELEKLGHQVVRHCDETTDLIFCRSVIMMNKCWEQHVRFKKPMVQYNWDVYSWALKTPRPNEYDYDSYKKLCEQSLEVWVPSRAVQKSLEDFWGMKSRVMKCYFPTKYYEAVGDDGYAFQGLRRNPDIHMDWFQEAAQAIGIRHKYTNPDFPMEELEYRHTLSHSRILVSPIYEMSTGGMFLFEGAMFGKPILASNSPYMGVVDYLGDSIEYFEWDDFEDLKKKMLKIFNGDYEGDTKRAKELVEAMTPDKHARDIDQRLKELL